MALVSNAAASREEELRRLMPPPPPRPPSAVTAPKVLDEETYTQQLEAIIERDYFPELPKMANQLEWLRAVNSGDIREMQRAQRNIARRRAVAMAAGGSAAGETPGIMTTTMPPAFQTPGAPGTGWAAATPGTGLLRTPAMTPAVGGAGGEAASGGGGGAVPVTAVAAGAAPAAGPVDPGLSLDGFLSRYTSEDNASFQAILEEDNRRKRAKVQHHLERPDPRDPETRQLLLEGPKDRPSDEYGTTGQAPMTLLPAPEPPVNVLFYDSSQRPDVPFSAKEVAERSLGLPKAINRAGTRLKAAPEAPPAPVLSAAAVIAAAAAAAAEGGGAATAGLPAGAPMPGGHAGTVGYAPMSTPAMEEILASPLMTWGDIESTPLRLGADDMPVELDLEALVGGGPAFKVQGLTEREQVAHRLAAAKAGSGTAAGRATAARGATPLLTALRRAATGTGGGAGATARRAGGGATPLAVPLSPAARQLAANIKAGTTPRGAGAGALAASAGAGFRGHRSGHGRGGGGGGGSAAAAAPTAAAAAASAAAAARAAALGSGELDKQLRASYRSAAASQGTPAAAGHHRIPTPGGAAAGAGALTGIGAKAAGLSGAAALGSSRRTPVVLGTKRPTTAVATGAGPSSTAGAGGGGNSVTDDLLKL